MSPDQARRRPPTAQQFVLGELRRAITTGRLRPGAPIRQDALAEELQVSRVPLREALKTLQGEGLVRYEAHRGYFVETLSLDDLREVYRIRELLEEEAVRRAVERLADADLDRLEEIQADVERAAAEGDVLAMTTANRLLVPIQPSFYPLQGTNDLLATYQHVKEKLNPTLDLLGVLITMYDPRTTIAREALAEIQNAFGDKVLEAIIHRNVKIEESPAASQSVFTYAPKSRAAQEYRAAYRELMDRA